MNDSSSSNGTANLPRRLVLFIAVVGVVGAVLIAHSLVTVWTDGIGPYPVALAAVVIASGRFAIKVPGRPAKVSVSEFFVFASALLFGPAVATLTVAVDGLWISAMQRDRRLYRALFNVAEPAISICAGAQMFNALSATGSGLLPPSMPLILANIAMAGTYFALNSGLTSVALAIESGVSPYAVWRSHAQYLALNYYAASSLATLAVGEGTGLNGAVIGLLVPLLMLSYVTYREASTREDEAHRHAAHVEHLYRASVDMLAVAVETKDQVTHGHIYRVQRHCLAVAGALGVSDPLELKAIEAGALLHDIGKLAVPDYVLNKPSALTRTEFDTMKKHASMGARILMAVDFPYPVVPIVRHHHEQWNGRGYPDGLMGRQIPLAARILAVVDCFDALTSDRPYRPRMSDETAIQILRDRRGSFYDPEIVDKFIEMIPTLRRNDLAAGDTHGMGQPDSAERMPPPGQVNGTHSASVAASARALIDRHMAQLNGAEACLFVIEDEDLLVAGHATGALRDEIMSRQTALGQGVSGWVAANRSTIRSADASLDYTDIAQKLQFGTCTSTPVFVCGDLFGVLTVYLRDSTPVAQEIVAQAGILAQQVGLILAGIPPRGSLEFQRSFSLPQAS